MAAEATSPMSGNDPVLVASGLAKSFDGVIAVSDVSFRVHAGEMLAMIGPNGAGKTTCFNMVNGQLRADAGSVSLRGARIDALAPRAIARAGIGRTFQVAATFASMTVRENVQLALIVKAREEQRLGCRAAKMHIRQADALLTRVGMATLADQGCGTLSYGDTKRIELALALAAAPTLLLMDEPTAGMPMAGRLELMRLVRQLARDDGLAVLFTEHDMDVVFAHADRVIVLDRGRVIAEGTPDAIRSDPRVRDIYLGSGAGSEV
jgi:branched-chain amino acid transport system ATP-binding protein